MQYQTIILELIQQNEPIYRQLCQERKLLATVNLAALELKASHETYLESMARTNPEQGALQAYHQAFELAIEEMKERLLPSSPKDEEETVSLDEIMACVVAQKMSN